MKLADARIAWSPRSSSKPTAGHVMIGLRSDDYIYGWSRRFDHWSELAEDRATRTGGWMNIGLMFVRFHELIVRDGIDPQEAHAAFLLVDEYRQRIAEDIHGAVGVPEVDDTCRCEASWLAARTRGFSTN